jgi:hypothetical protein
MTEQQARALAAKREAHKSKHLRAVWTACHNSVRGWHVALVTPPIAGTQDDADDALANSLVCTEPRLAGLILIEEIGMQRAQRAAERMIARLTGRAVRDSVEDATYKALEQ